MSEIPKFVICLGSNTPGRSKIISSVIVRLAELCAVVVKSDMYEAPDESGLGAPYLNVVLSIVPNLELESFKSVLKELERKHGRTMLSKSVGIMPLDADIIIWHGKIVDRYQYSREYFQIGYRQITGE